MKERAKKKNRGENTGERIERASEEKQRERKSYRGETGNKRARERIERAREEKQGKKELERE